MPQKIPGSKVRERATQILSNQYKDSALKVRRAWEDAKVPDNSEDAYLVIYHWEDFGDARGVDPATDAIPQKVLDTFEKAPSGGVREYRNRLVFLVPSRDGHDNMLTSMLSCSRSRAAARHPRAAAEPGAGQAR